MNISKEQYEKILECFMKSLLKNGLKATTMDSIAASLQMSKRTLYEIFGTKDEIFRQTHQFFHNKMKEKMAEIYCSSSNVMEGIIKCFLYHRDLMSNLSVDFIKDMGEYSIQRQLPSDSRHKLHYQNLHDLLQKGVAEGFFRTDINLLVQCRMLLLQMEALKGTQDLFPKDISLLEIYDSIILTFLRGISTPAGLDELEKFKPALTPNYHQNENKD